MTMKKVKAIAEGKDIRVEESVKKEVDKINPEVFLHDMKSLTEGFRQTKLSDTNAAAYIQSAVDVGTLFLHTGLSRSPTMIEIRRLTGR